MRYRTSRCHDAPSSGNTFGGRENGRGNSDLHATQYDMVNVITLLLRVPEYIITFPYYFSFCTLSLSSFWTSRGHKCHPFSSPVLAFNFYRA